MNFLLLILLTIGGWRAEDVRYERACVRLASLTGDHVTCDLLERAYAARQDDGDGDGKGDDTSDISNGF